jgi:hypothetical protein
MRATQWTCDRCKKSVDATKISHVDMLIRGGGSPYDDRPDRASSVVVDTGPKDLCEDCLAAWRKLVNGALNVETVPAR